MTLTVDGVAAGGDGIGRHPDGRVVFVDGALPGEQVGAEVIEERRDFLRATTTSVIEASPDRVSPPCPWVEAGCGGCQWQHVAPGAQAGLKARIVVDALRHLARLSVPVAVAPGAPPSGYRTALRLAVDPDGRACYRRRRSYDLVAVDSCLIAHPSLAELVAAGRFPGARQVTLRVGARTGERLVYPSPTSVAPSVRVPADVVVARRARTFIHEEAAGVRWRISATSFFQAGPEAAEAVVAAVSRAVGPRTGTLVDAYCGVGLLGGALVHRQPGWRVVGVESHAAAAADARANLAGLDARVVQAEVADARVWARGLGAVDVVVADPARTGLGRSAAAALAGTNAAVLVLVSCDPASLARDVQLLAGHGYLLSGIDVVDVFPHTFHVETVSRFTKE